MTNALITLLLLLLANKADAYVTKISHTRRSTHLYGISINPLVSQVQPSKTVEIFSKVKEMQASGIEVTSLCVGEPDFPPPQAVLTAIAEAASGGRDTTYTAVTGTAELRGAIANDLSKRKGTVYDPATQIVVANGAKQCVYQAVLATCGQGDAVLIPAPYWPSYPEMARLAGASADIVESTSESGYLLTADQLRSSLEENSNIKLLILCNPSNPTGGVYSKEQLQELAAVLEDFPQVVILADEIYERLAYADDGSTQQVTSFASISGMFDRTLTVNGFSKAYAMTGLRLGYVAGPTQLIKPITTIQSQLTSCAGSLSQLAGVAALTQVAEEELEANTKVMKKKRDYVLERLADMPKVHLEVPPRGAFYVLPDISEICGTEDTQFCLDLLAEQRLALVPGTSFGAPGTVRISYATSMEELVVAMDKLESFVKSQIEAS